MKWLKTLFQQARHWFSSKPQQNRPHFMSKKAWWYRSKGKLTAAQALYVKLGVM